MLMDRHCVGVDILLLLQLNGRSSKMEENVFLIAYVLEISVPLISKLEPYKPVESLTVQHFPIDLFSVVDQ